MDIVKYNVYGQNVGEWRYVLDQSVAWSLLNDMIKGNLSGYSTSDLFQSNSDYVVKLSYFPFIIGNFSTLGASQSTLTLGKNTFNYTCKPLITQTSSVQIAKFTLTETFNNFLDDEPYSTYTLHVPFFEPIKIPFAYIKNFYEFQLYLSIDFNSGFATLYLMAQESSGGTDYVLVSEKTSKVSIDVALGKSNKEEQQRNNMLQMISGIGSAVGLYLGVSSGNPLLTAGSVGMLTKNVTQAIANNVDRISSYHGSNGNRSSLCVDKRIYLIMEKPTNVNYPNASIKGKPCRKNLTLSSLSGYTEIGEIHFNPSDAEIFEDEISEINDLLRSGVIL